MNDYYVYILSNKSRILYTGVTNNLFRRVFQHKHKMLEGFTKKYNIDKLVYFEHTTQIESAIRREKEIKKWRREKKMKLITGTNPLFEDLSAEWYKE
jgi:putative endonuclease